MISINKPFTEMSLEELQKASEDFSKIELPHSRKPESLSVKVKNDYLSGLKFSELTSHSGLRIVEHGPIGEYTRPITEKERSDLIRFFENKKE